MNTLTPSTTNFAVVATVAPYDTSWTYQPYCAPAGDYIGMVNSVAGSTMTIEGYQFGGWSNP